MSFTIILTKMGEFTYYRVMHNNRTGILYHTWRVSEELSGCWITMTCAAYAIALRIIFVCFTRKTCLLQLKMLSYPDPASAVRNYACEVSELHERFENCFNLMPLLWFFTAVIEGPRVVMVLSRCSLVEFLLFVSWPINCIVAPIVVCFLISSLKSQMEKRLTDTYRLLCKNKCIRCQDNNEILFNLDSIKSQQFTGFGFFAMNRSFVLSLVGTIFTVSALLDQYIKRA